MLRIRLAGADVVLHPSGAALLSADETLLVAAHFGKAVSFRQLGVPVPSGTTPAFGSFTGMHRIEPRAGDRIFPGAGDAVRAIPALPVA